MTLLSYQVLKTVADQGSFRKAAELLGLTPSAVSHAVSSMEKELGFFVFNRGKNGVMLTNYGERLLPYVNAVLNSDESLQQAVAEFNGLKQGRIKIGCFSSVCTNWMPELIHAFAKSYPAIEMEIFQGTYDDVSYWIKNGVVDVGFLSVSSAGEIPIVPLYKDPLLCVVPKGLRTRQGRMEVEELREYQFVTQRESTDADIQNFMKEHDLNVTSNYHVVDDLSTVAMVAHGFGICLMPEMVMQDIPYEVDCFHLKEDAYRIIGLAALDFEAMAPAVRMFYEQVVKNYKQPLD
ncbi:MAG: LysR family transcriptional regulator [Eubacterium sp.]|jgi:DNA-binding transcriptional LysR family regulator|nr:LysR family transcriptional regulator [Eubacterium sp.]CCZ89941.1 transcriptional regulator [Clostridium sp. CAG:167]